jgi:hypothetical protein
MDKARLERGIKYTIEHFVKYDIEVENVQHENGEILIRIKKTDELIAFYAGTGTVKRI